MAGPCSFTALRAAQVKYFLCKIEQTWTGTRPLMPSGGDGREKQMYIVQCQPCTPGGATKITTATKKAALEAASDFLNEGMPFVSIRLSGRVYTAEEFATTMAGARKRWA